MWRRFPNLRFHLHLAIVRKFPKNFRVPHQCKQNHSRGYLPHVVKPGASYFVTFRLADSLPGEALMKLEEELRTWKAPPCSADFPICASSNHTLSLPRPTSQPELHRERRKRIESYLDLGVGASLLKDERIAEAACSALNFFDAQRYELRDWVIMPNHVHAIVRPINAWTLSAITQSWKIKIAREANQILRKTGKRFWQPESFDRVIRDDDEMRRVRKYIRRNPVKARLCAKEEDWKWSSAWTGWT